jgi:hypothetical protein
MYIDDTRPFMLVQGLRLVHVHPSKRNKYLSMHVLGGARTGRSLNTCMFLYARSGVCLLLTWAFGCNLASMCTIHLRSRRVMNVSCDALLLELNRLARINRYIFDQRFIIIIAKMHIY